MLRKNMGLAGGLDSLCNYDQRNKESGAGISMIRWNQ